MLGEPAGSNQETEKQNLLDYQVISLSPFDKSQFSYLHDLNAMWQLITKKLQDNSNAASEQIEFRLDEESAHRVHEIKIKFTENHHKISFVIRGQNFKHYRMVTGMIDDGMSPFFEHEPMDLMQIEAADGMFEIINSVECPDQEIGFNFLKIQFFRQTEPSDYLSSIQTVQLTPFNQP